MQDYEQIMNVYRFLEDKDISGFELSKAEKIINKEKFLQSHVDICTNTKSQQVFRVNWDRLMKVFNYFKK